LLRLLALRLLIIGLPFLGYFLWRAFARRTGRPVGPTPWTWLIGASLGIAVVVMIAAATINSGGTGRYVPAQTRPDGSVEPGRFEELKTPPR
jgi:hypothetical protein